MTSKQKCWDWQWGYFGSLFVGGVIALSDNLTLAQIVPDTTLPVNSIATPDANTSVITGGTQAGSNLFHSFEQFSISTGSTAYFNNSLEIQNILTRVTGGSISNIDGLIRANGVANLFLLNPNGIIFGPNARLNIGGSFLASTASGLRFADGTEFSATTPQTTPLLTISVPVGLQYGGNQQGILVQGSFLEMQPEKTLVLAGGNVSIDGGVLSVWRGQVGLASVAGAGTVVLNLDGNNLNLSLPDGLARADIFLTSGARLESIPLNETDGGDINIQAGLLSLTDGSSLISGNLGRNGGSIFVQANSVSLTDSSISSNNFGKNGGNINIQADLLSLTNSHLMADTLGGQAGSIFVQVGDLASLSNSYISSSNFGGGGGDVNIRAGSVSLTNNSQISATSGTEGSGKAGSVLVRARDSVFTANNSSISSEALVGSLSESGNIRIRPLQKLSKPL